MSKVREVKEAGQIKYYFQCPGCNSEHKINDSWNYNDDAESPTFKPSVLGRGKSPNKDGVWQDWQCHSFITDGKIRFLNDCTHDLAGQTVELPEVETDN